ncbi:M10 family metallopeptidase [Microvirga thermotolerans]|uniref:M10 family metallopeptidase n=1 Tax=Microvirga thermotolerans TaxID=2651334 RepID=UPI0018832E0F|nr:M10 family metallopeptidase [Microvirga thermotolerans]
MPLGIFSAAAAGLPNVAIAGTRYYAPTHIDRDVLALFSGSQWAKGSISYSFPDSRWDYEWINPSASGFKPASQATQNAFHGIFKGAPGVMSLTSLESFTNATFVYAGRDGADIKLSAFQPGSVINRSHGYYPGVPVYGGDTWITNAHETPAFSMLGTYQYYLLLHELGHSLGMKHTHDSGGNLPKMSAGHDSTEFTVMSYNVTGRPQTFMMYDIAALQEMYGADFTTNSGNTVYSWSPQTGETFVNGVGQGKPGYDNKIFLTIWDGGGNDTYNFENYTSNAVIDLAPGSTSLFSPSQRADVRVNGNVYNALQFKGDSRSLIENAWGGSGHDKILGNAAANQLRGNGGNDTLSGRDGNDTLMGGDGSDFLAGDAGSDTLYGGTGHDSLWGSTGQDSLYGEDGDDFVAGESGNDFLAGHAGDDRIYGGTEHDTLWGGTGQDTLWGEDGNDFVAGEDGNDFLAGNAGGDILFGGIGEDSLYGGTGGDNLYGENGDDFVAGEDGADNLQGGNGNDRLIGGSGTDTLYGGAGNDYLDMDDSASAGADSLYGEDGNDVLVGAGIGSRLSGGAGQDIFAIRPWTKTTITDFYSGPAGADQIQIWNKPLFANFSVMMASARQIGSDVVIAKGDFSLTLSNTQLSSLAAKDFLFL